MCFFTIAVCIKCRCHLTTFLRVLYVQFVLMISMKALVEKKIKLKVSLSEDIFNKIFAQEKKITLDESNFLRHNGVKPFMKSHSHIRFDMIITKFLIVHVIPNRFLPHCFGPKMSDILSFQSKLESSKRKETAIFQTCCVTRRNFSFLSPF